MHNCEEDTKYPTRQSIPKAAGGGYHVWIASGVNMSSSLLRCFPSVFARSSRRERRGNLHGGRKPCNGEFVRFLPLSSGCCGLLRYSLTLVPRKDGLIIVQQSIKKQSNHAKSLSRLCEEDTKYPTRQSIPKAAGGGYHVWIASLSARPSLRGGGLPPTKQSTRTGMFSRKDSKTIPFSMKIVL